MLNKSSEDADLELCLHSLIDTDGKEAVGAAGGYDYVIQNNILRLSHKSQIAECRRSDCGVTATLENNTAFFPVQAHDVPRKSQSRRRAAGKVCQRFPSQHKLK